MATSRSNASGNPSAMMQNAASKNQLDLSGISVEGFLIKDLKPILQSSECPLNGDPKA
jgi:hypothetical protein